MPVVKIGGSLNSFVEDDKSPKVDRSEAGDIVTRTGSLKNSQVKAYLDALVFGTADSVYTSAVLTGAQADQITGDTTKITLTYSPVNASFEVLPPVGTVIQEVDANGIDIPLKKNPNATSVYIDAEIKKGVEAYLSPQPIYRRIEILGSYAFDENGGLDSMEEVQSVGLIDDTPEGIANPQATKWLKTGYVVRAVGDKFEKTETWQYAENGWDTDLYITIP
jgi:hypothetical protein